MQENVATPWRNRQRRSPSNDLLCEVEYDSWWVTTYYTRDGGVQSCAGLPTEEEAMAWCDKAMELDGWVAATPPHLMAIRLGIPYSPHTRSAAPTLAEQGLPGWAWDGRVMHGLSHTGRPHDMHTLFHELGHWLCAEPYLRHRHDFGVHTYGQEAAAHLVGEVLRRASGDDSGPPPALTDYVDRMALARATELMKTAGIIYRTIQVLDVVNVPV